MSNSAARTGFGAQGLVQAGQRGARVMRRATLLSATALVAVTASPASATDYTVTTAAELASAITAVNAGTTTDRIIVANGITLDRLLPAIRRGVTVVGNGNTISGADTYRIFFVDAGAAAVSLQNVVLADGRAKGGDGGAGGGGGLGAGGAVFVNSGAVTATNVTFSGNDAVGGTTPAATDGNTSGGGGGLGGSGGSPGFGGGGGGGYSGGGGGGGGTVQNSTIQGGAGGDGPGGAGGAGAAQGPGGAGVNGGAGGNGSSGGTFNFGGGGGGGGQGGGAGGGNPNGVNGGGGGGGYTGTGGAGSGTGAATAGTIGGGGGGGGAIVGAGAAGGEFGGGGGGFFSGAGGAGGFGGGGGGSRGGTGGVGGFGGGGGKGAVGGVGGGAGGGTGGISGGGGGAGLGGAVFVRSGNGASLTLGYTADNAAAIAGGTAVGGTGANAGAGAGSGLFLASGTTTTISTGRFVTIADRIADDSASSLPGGGFTAGTGAGAAVQFNGGGFVTLTGANTYAGGTSVTGSSGLQIGVDGGTSGSILGNVTLAGNSFIRFQRGDTTSFAGAIGGDGSVQVGASSGTTNLTLIGDVTATGGIDQFLGTLTVGNVTAMTSPAVEMNGGTLNVVAGKTVSAGAQAISTLAGRAATINNAGAIVGGSFGLTSSGNAIVSNAGTIGVGVFAGGAFAASASNAGGVGAGIMFTTSGTVTNNAGGMIQGSTGTTFGGSIQAGIYSAGGVLTLDNSGSIAGGVWGVIASSTVDITNRAGSITGTTNNAIYTGGGSGSIVRNFATLNGGNAGVYSDGTNLIVTNAAGATIRAMGAPNAANNTVASGIYASNTGAAITNGGTITSSIEGGRGINLAQGGMVTNSAGGTISATGVTGTGVFVTGGALTLTNAGRISGPTFAVQNSGTGVSTISLLAGTSTGAIQLGAANDFVTLFAGNANTTAAAAFTTIDLGTGTNSLILSGSGADAATGGAVGQQGTLDLAALTGLSTLTKLSTGTWNLTGAATGTTAAATIFAGDGTLLRGQGLLNFTGSSGLTGEIYVNGATVQASGAGTLGTGSIHMVDPTLVFATASAGYSNNFVLDVAKPGQGSPSDTSNDPSTFIANPGMVATLTGAITTGSGNNINGYQIDPVQPVVFGGGGTVVLTNGANSWTGTATINASTVLRGTTASLSGGSFVDNGTLNYNQATAGSSARAISGGGNLLIDGGGPVTLTGAITVGAGTQIGANTTATLSNASGTGITVVTVTGANATLNVASGGSIAAINGNAVGGGGSVPTINNAGTITASGTNAGSGVSLSGSATSTIGNTGLIESSLGTTIYNSGTGKLSVANSGIIRNTGAGTANTIDLGAGVVSATASLAVDNQANGVITTSATGNAVGSYGNGTLTVTNAGTLQKTQAGGLTSTVASSGLGGASVTNLATGVIANVSGTGVVGTAGPLTVTNAGRISGGDNAGVGFGVRTAGASATVINQTGGVVEGVTGAIRGAGPALTITNSGTVRGTGVSGTGVSGTTGTVSLTNNSGATVSGTTFGVQTTGGALTITNNGTITGGTAAIASTGTFADTVTLGAASTTTGGVQLGAGADTLNFMLGAAVTGTLDGGADIDNLVVGGAGTATLPTAINFENLIKNGTGTLTLATDGGFTATAVNAGALVVNAMTASSTTVASGATLTGSGSVGATTIADGGILVGTQGTTLTLASLVLSPNSIINTTFDAPNGNPLFAVTGNLTLDGTVNVASTTPFGFGIYRLISYGGTLTDNGLVVGATPMDAQRTTVQTSIAGQVNLVSSSSDLLYWDGGNPALYNNGAIDGGTGTWTATSPTFTDANGLFNGAMTPQPGFAIFAAAPGTVTVDGSAGAISVTGIQFASNGYVVTGDPIGLAAPTTTIRVGDGTAAGAAFVATIGSALTGANALDKSDLGTLILSGANTYTGLTTVSGGTLVLAGGRATADTSAVSIASGGTLQLNTSETIGSLAGAGNVVLGANTLTTGALNASPTFSGIASGTGGLTKVGTGTLTLSGANTYTGATTINAGTLALSGGVAIADASAVAIASAGTLLLNASETIGSLGGAGNVVLGANTLTTGGLNASPTFSGVLSGTGGLTKVGTGTLTLSGPNSYTGATTINAGTLALSGGVAIADASAVTIASSGTLLLNASETTGSLAGAGNVVLGANTLTTGGLNASPTFSGVLSGTGGLAKVGTGTLTLSGANTYTGATTINAGALALGASNVLADATAVTVASGAILDLATFSDTVGTLALAGTLNGTGTLTAASYTLTGAAVNANLGAGTLTQAGGTSTLNGTAGAATVGVNAGTLKLGAANRLADAAAVTVVSGAVLDLATFSDTVGTLQLNGALNGTGTLTAASYTLNGAAVNANLGAGTLVQAGSTSVLAGTSAAATVNVNAGTLRLAADERLADASAVTIAGGATFDVAGRTETIGSVGGAGTVALGAGRLVLAGAGASRLGALTGTGVVDKTGTGTLTLANGYAATGSINTAAGSTVFTGTTAGALRVSGGTLSGTGTAAGGLTLTGGTVAPGVAGATNGSQFGTLSVGGLTATGGTYAVDFGGAASGFASDLIRVSGAAALSGAVAVAPTSFVGNERFQQTYTIVQANSLTGTFANGATFGAVSNDPTLFYRLRYDLVPNAVVLQVQRQIDFAASVPAGTGNQLAFARALNGSAGLASDAYAATLNAIAGSGGDRGATYDSLSGEAIADVTSSALFVSDRFIDLLRARVGLHRGGAAGAAQYALRAGVGDGQRHASGFAGALEDGVDTNDGSASSNGGGIWLQGQGAGQRLRGLPGQARTDSFVSGLAGGFDGQFGNVSAAAAGGFSALDTRVQTRGSRIEGTLYQAGAYLAYDNGTVYGQLAGDYYSGDVTITRQLAIGGNVVGQARGTTNVRGYTVGGLLGVRADIGGGTRAGVELTAQQTQATRRAYTETAPLGLGLSAPRDSRDVFTGAAQVKVSHLFTGNGWSAEPFASGGVEVHTGDLATINAMQIGAAPTGTGGFLVQGATLEHTLGVFTGGVEIRPSDRFRIDLSAGGKIGNRTREGEIKVSARIAF